jgi:hypothetical protein
MGQKTLVDVRFNDLTDNQGVAAKVQGMEDYTFKIDGAFLYERCSLRDAIKSMKNLSLVFNVPGIDSTVVHLFNHVSRGDVNGKCALLFNPFQLYTVPVVVRPRVPAVLMLQYRTRRQSYNWAFHPL